MGRCICGWSGQDDARFWRGDARRQAFRAHAVAHLSWWEGVPLVGPNDILTALEWARGWAVITTHDRARRRSVARALSDHLKREMGYGSLFPAANLPGDHIRAVVRVEHKRAIAAAFVSSCDQWGTGTGDAWRVVSGEPTPMIVGLFVAASWRRMGVGTELIRLVADQAGVPCADLVFTRPISAGGLACIGKLVATEHLRVS